LALRPERRPKPIEPPKALEMRTRRGSRGDKRLRGASAMAGDSKRPAVRLPRWRARRESLARIVRSACSRLDSDHVHPQATADGAYSNTSRDTIPERTATVAYVRTQSPLGSHESVGPAGVDARSRSPRSVRRSTCLVFSRSLTHSRLSALKSRSIWLGSSSRSRSSTPTMAAQLRPLRLARWGVRLRSKPATEV
jgi:hypothetical protein